MLCCNSSMPRSILYSSRRKDVNFWERYLPRPIQGRRRSSTSRQWPTHSWSTLNLASWRSCIPEMRSKQAAEERIRQYLPRIWERCRFWLLRTSMMIMPTLPRRKHSRTAFSSIKLRTWKTGRSWSSKNTSHCRPISLNKRMEPTWKSWLTICGLLCSSSFSLASSLSSSSGRIASSIPTKQQLKLRWAH